MEDMTTAQTVAALVQALNALSTPRWTDVVQAVSVLVVGLLQCGLIYFGLRQMSKTSEERNRQLDQHGETLAAIGAGIQALLKERGREGQG